MENFPIIRETVTPSDSMQPENESVVYSVLKN